MTAHPPVRQNMESAMSNGHGPDHASAKGGSNESNDDGWTDILPLLASAAQELKTGELLRAPHFELVDCMSVLEIMDPKMDAGLHLVQQNPAPEFDPEAPRTPAEVLWIMDQFSVCEMTWQSGHSDIQTLHTCRYLPHLVYLAESAVDRYRDERFWTFTLYTYLLAVLHGAHLVWTEMRKGHLYEDEDFTTATHGQPFPQHLTVSQSRRLLVGAIEGVKARLAALAATPAPAPNGAPSGATAAPPRKPTDRRVLLAVLNRLEIRLLWLRILQLHPYTPEACANVECLVDTYFTHRRSDNRVERTAQAVGCPVQGVFDPNAGLKLIEQTPPRAIRLLTVTEAGGAMDQLLTGLQRLLQIRNFDSSMSLVTFLALFHDGARAPAPFVRSLIMTLLDVHGTVFEHRSHHQLIADRVREFCCPPRQFLPPDAETAPCLATPSNQDRTAPVTRPDTLATQFIKHTTGAYLSYLKVFSQNLARQRRLQRRLLTDWDTIYVQTLELERQNAEINRALTRATDRHIPQEYGYFSAWAMDVKLTVMIRFVLSGVALDIYKPGELIIIYWYADYLQSVRISHIQSVRDSITRIAEASDYDGIDRAAFERTIHLLRSMRGRLCVEQELCRGLVMVLAALARLGQHDRWDFGLSDVKAYFDTRFRVFLGVSIPTLLDHTQWTQVGQYFADSPPEPLLERAEDHFSECLRQLDDLAYNPADFRGYRFCIDTSLQRYLADVRRTAVLNRQTVSWLQDRLENDPVSLRAGRRLVKCSSLTYSPAFVVFRPPES
ncbi:N-alpha-acetyltransferase, non-catalitic subunit [Tieghemiomyces parasiticus]|uniref:N-alpha-acetyltransferase, non-catalitic subunit n=1 Tax=Tieghemiomyces parasiticus TaxID=78921 RepID=A0A9W8AF79_9FUNG|nr:N-alpha-acetyltransferase, non-catalitic subunit [Tieghemiomyces parasiticus]